MLNVRFSTPFLKFVLVPILRVGMQVVALRADIPKAKLTWQISVPNLWIGPLLG